MVGVVWMVKHSAGKRRKLGYVIPTESQTNYGTSFEPSSSVALVYAVGGYYDVRFCTCRTIFVLGS